MENYSYSYSSCLLALLLPLLALVIIISQRRRQKLLPPGPKGWPIIGNLYLAGPNRHLSFHMLSQKYGPLMLLKFFQSPVIVVSSPEMAKLFLKTHDRVFAARPPFAAGKYINYDHSNILWSPSGQYWRQLRKVATAEMSIMNSTTSVYDRVRFEERRNLFSRLQSLSGEPVIIRDHITRYIVSMICKMVLGEDYFGDNPEVIVDQLLELLDEWIVLTGTFYIGDWAPWLHFLDGGASIRKMKSVGKKFDRLTSYVIDSHLSTKASNTAQKDAIDGLLHHAEAHQLPRSSIKALIQDFLIAGTESTIVTVEWAMQEICKQPCIYEKAKEELKNIEINSEGTFVSKEDFSRLPYIDAIIMETLRLHPPATVAPPHYATDDCKVAGYDIPKGAVVLINTWSLGRDPDSWESPNEFLPERFLGQEIDMLGNNFALLPFGSGRRVCPGYTLGLNNVRETLANLLHGFDWKLPHGMKPEDVCMEEEYGINTHPKVPLAIIMESTLA